MRRHGRRIGQGAAMPRRRWRSLAWLPLVLAALASPLAAQPPGVRLDFDTLLDRQEQRQRGTLLEFGVSMRLRAEPLDDSIVKRELLYSPTTGLVYELRSPGFLPGRPEFYLFDGAYFVYEPRDFDTPSLELSALPPTAQQDRALLAAKRRLLASSRGQAFGAQGAAGAGQGFEVTVVKALPGPLSTMFGRDATTIRVTGRESISFAGESRRVTPYIASEQGRGQSLFPRLDMDQDLQVKLEGNIGGKVHVAVDHNSSAFGTDANRVNVYYEGYEDDIVRRIDLGGTNMAMPGSRLVAPPGLSQGVFGVKTDLRLAGLDVTLLAAKEETEAETRTLTPSGGSATVTPVNEDAYVRDKFYFYELPDSTRGADPEDLYFSYGLHPGSLDATNQYTPGQLIDENLGAKFRIYIDDNNQNLELRPWRGYAVANLPAGIDTAAMTSAYNNSPNEARWPSQEAGVNYYDPEANVGHWRQVPDTDIGYVFFEANGQKLVLGFFLRNGPLSDNAALAVNFVDPRGAEVGNFDESPTTVRLRLIRHPDSNNDFYRYPTSLLMMRHVYSLGTTGIQDIELGIEARSTGNLKPDAPLKLPQSTYLHMFGLDELDQANRRGPDGFFDASRANLLDRENGFLFMPGLRPFSPPDAVVIARLISAGVSEDSASTFREELFGKNEIVSPTLYTLPRDDDTKPSGLYQMLVGTRGTETQITLPQDILENSDVVRLDGRQLARGVDYDIEPVAGGKITFKGAVLNEITPSSKIEVSYAYKPLLGTGQGTLLGMSGKYDLGARGYLASVWMWESRQSFAKQPQLGDEPSRNLVGDVNMNLRFQPGWMTGLANLLPFTRTNAASGLTISAEAAMSVPNPNTKNTAFVEDMESADTSDRVANAREAWYPAAMPDPLMALADTVLRIPTYFYNPAPDKDSNEPEVKRGHLNPTLPETEAKDGIPALELGFDRDVVTDLLTNQPSLAPRLWAGVQTVFSGNGLDLTQARTIEFWLDDGVGVPAERRGRMHIDFGDISEDFVFFQNNPSRTGGPLSSPRFNREAETDFQFLAGTDDLGWNGRIDALPENEIQYPRGNDRLDASHQNAAKQHTFANGTEGDNRFDTEDINGDGEWDTKNSFFRFTFDLNDESLIDPGTDINPTYGSNPNIDPTLKPGFLGWRHYRIDFQALVREALLDTVVAPGQTPPTLRQIRYLRIWFDDPQAPAEPTGQIWMRDFHLHEFEFTGTQWLQLGVFGVDSTQVAPAPGETFTVSVINNKDSPEYTIPPDAELIDTAGVQAREQALRLTFDNLRPGHEMVTQKTNPQGRPTDYTLYNRMNFFTNVQTSFADSVEVFFRMGTDSLNFYEVARPLQGVRGWVETIFDLKSLTDLKFPEDVGASVDTLDFGGRAVVQARRRVPDVANPNAWLTLTRRGNPSLKQVSRLFVGVRYPDALRRGGLVPPSGGLPSDGAGTVQPSPLQPGGITGDLWFNNVRLEDPRRDLGTAQLYSVQGNFADVFEFNSSLSTRDADFLGLRQRTGSGSDTYNFQTNLKLADAGRVVPTLGFTIPISYTTARDVSRPKFFTSSDTENDDARADEQRNENVREGFGFSVQKKPSKFFLFKPTLDRLSFSYNKSKTARRTFTSRDTTDSWTQNLNYDLSPRPRTIPILFKQQLNLLPTNIKFGVQHQQSHGISYTSSTAAPELLAPKPEVETRTLNWNGAAAVRPLNLLNAAYSFNESRDYREAHPDNQAEAFSLMGFDFGIPTGRNEALSIDVNPRVFQYSYAANYADRRTLQIDADTGLPRPDLHTLSSGRTHRFSFDFKLHRRLASVFGGAPPRRAPPPAPGGVPPQDDELGGAPGQPGAGGSGTPEAGGQPPPEPEPPPEREAPPDTAAAAPRRFPNPLRPLFRFVGGIEPVKVEWSDNRTATFTSLPGEAGYAYRFGFSTSSGVPGFDVPTPLNNSMSLNLSSAIPLRGALRVTVRYGLRDTDVESRSGVDSLLRVNVNSTQETNFPSLELSINDLQKLRIFGSKLQRSTLTLGYNRTESERFAQDFDARGTLTRETGRRESQNTVITANWTGQWTGTTATTLAVNQTSGEESQPGTRSTNTRRSIQGTCRFKLASQGGISLPWIGALKTGLDVLVNASYNKDLGKLFNNPNDPSLSIPQRETSSIAGGVRGDFTLSRNMTSGMELGYTRSRDEKNNQTITTIRLGVNLTFLF